MEGYAKNKLKVPIHQGHHSGTVPIATKITRSDAADLITQSKKMRSIGHTFVKDSQMANVIKHDYLKKAIE